MTTPGPRDTDDTADDGTQRDRWLREALRHAPDAQQPVPSALSETILRAARAQVAEVRPVAVPPPKSRLTRWFDALARPQVAGGFASVLLASFIGVMWWDMPVDVAVPPTGGSAPPQAAPSAEAPPVAKESPMPPAAEPLARTDVSRAESPRKDRKDPRESAAQYRKPRPDRAEDAAPPQVADAAPSQEAGARADRAADVATAKSRDETLKRMPGSTAGRTAPPVAAAPPTPAAMPSPAPVIAAAEPAPRAERKAEAEAAAPPAAPASGQAASPARRNAVTAWAAPAPSELDRLREQIAAEPGRWTWRHGGTDAPRAFGADVSAWLGSLDAAAGRRWEPESTQVPVDALELSFDGTVVHRWWIADGRVRWQRGNGDVTGFAMPESVAPRLHMAFERLR